MENTVSTYDIEINWLLAWTSAQKFRYFKCDMIDSSLFICNQICGISYLHLIIKQKNASPENFSKCTYDLIAFSRRSLTKDFQVQHLDVEIWVKLKSEIDIHRKPIGLKCSWTWTAISSNNIYEALDYIFR